MDLVTPDVGLLFWTFCSFVILYFLLKKFAWKPILGTVNDREASIREALLAAENAKKEMENLKSDNEKILKEAKIDASLVGSLSSSIKDMEASAKSGADSADSLAKVNKEFADNAEKLQKQMASLAANLESLNNVYGGVLGAMNNKK